jgi:hypothetical protein
MAFNGDEGTVVSLDDASRWTANYRRTISSGEIIAQFLGREKLQAILDQEECEGIRFYYGIDDDGKKNLIAVGAKRNEDDMIEGIIVDKCSPCPPLCSTRNSLNS